MVGGGDLEPLLLQLVLLLQTTTGVPLHAWRAGMDDESILLWMVDTDCG